MATSSTTPVTIDYTYTKTDNNQGAVSTNEYKSRFIQMNSVTRGDSPPNWRQVIRRGDNATSSLEGYQVTYNATPALLRHWVQYKWQTAPAGYWESTFSGHLLYLGVFSNPTLGASEVSATNQALSRYYSNINAVRTKFQGMVFTGELRESLSMIRNPAKSLRRGIGDYLDYVKRRSRKVAKRERVKMAGEAWLEYSFGWKPLINDIDNGIRAFYASDLVRPIFEMVKGTGKSEVIDNPIPRSKSLGIGHRLTFREQRREEVHVKYFGIYRSSGKGVENLHHYGFHPAEFVPTVWELIPYSFLVDYFTNIGEIVSSWSYRFIRPAWTAKTIRRAFTASAVAPKVEFTESDSAYFHGVEGSVGSCSLEYKSVKRLASAPLELPSLELEVPGMSSVKWLNLAALAASHNSARKELRR